MVRQVMSGQTPKAAALAVGVCPRTIRKWVARYARKVSPDFRIAAHGPSPAPPDTATDCCNDRGVCGANADRQAIAAEPGVSPATVSRILRRLGLNRLSALEPEPVRRYERENPGELIHLDIKKLGKSAP